MLFAEAAEKWHLQHHIARPTILLGIVTLGLGLMHGRLASARERRRSLRLTDTQLVIKGRRIERRFSARWDEIASISVTEHEAQIRTHQGRLRRLNLSDLDNAGAVREVLEEAQRRLSRADRPVAS